MSASRTAVTLLAAAALLALASCEGRSLGQTKPIQPVAENASHPAAPGSAASVVIGSFEAGLATPLGTDWRAIDDKQGGGMSTSTIEIVDGGAGRTTKALKSSGLVKVKDYPFPFAGIGLPLGKVIEHVPTPTDLSVHRGIQLWVKGDGKRYMLRVMSNDVEDYNFFHYVFTAGPDWSLITVPFPMLVQFDWGEKVKWTGKSVSALMITNYSAPGEDFGDFTLFVDEISFL